MALTMHLRCPVRTCGESFDVVMDGDAYGVIPISDSGCAEITRNYAPEVEAHIAAHCTDGSWYVERNAQGA